MKLYFQHKAEKEWIKIQRLLKNYTKKMFQKTEEKSYKIQE